MRAFILLSEPTIAPSKFIKVSSELSKFLYTYSLGAKFNLFIYFVIFSFYFVVHGPF